MSLNPPNPSKPGPGRPAIDARAPEHVVALAPVGVGQDLVGLAGFLESGRRLGILVDVGVPLLGELAEGALDLGVARLARDAEDLVQIALGGGHRAGSLREGDGFGRGEDRRRTSRGVSLPVNVFCWLGWYVPMSRYGPTSTSAPWPNRGLRGSRCPFAAIARSAASQPYAPSATRTRTRSSSAELAGEVRRAGVALLGRRLVGRRGAADGGRDVRVGEGQPVVGAARDVGRSARPARWSAGEQEVARGVAGEDAAGAVAAVRRGREADQQDPRVGVAEARHRPAPVRLVAEPGDLLAGDLLAPLDEPRAATADDDLGGEGRQRGPVGHCSSSLSSRRETTNSPANPRTSRYTTWTSRSGEMRRPSASG